MTSQPLVRRPTGWPEVALTLFVFVVLLGASELVLRYLEPSYRRDWSSALFRESQDGCRSVLTPGLYRSGTVEGQPVHVQTNSNGLHWYETRFAKPPNIRRIALLGDSFAFGMWATSIRSSFAGVLDSLLADSPHAVINFGVPGYSINEMALQLDEEVMSYDPDFVLLTVYLGNDLSWTYATAPHDETCISTDDAEQIRDRIPVAYLPPRFKTKEELALSTQQKPVEVPMTIRARRFLRKHSALYRRLALLNDQPRELFADSIRVHHEFFQETFWSRKDYPVVAQAAIDTSIAQLKRVKSFLDERGVHLGIVAIPYREQVYAARPSGSTYDVARPQLYLERFANESAVPFFDLTPKLREVVHTEKQELHFKTDIHFTDKGHRLVGRLIFEWLTSQVLQ